MAGQQTATTMTAIRSGAVTRAEAADAFLSPPREASPNTRLLVPSSQIRSSTRANATVPRLTDGQNKRAPQANPGASPRVAR